MTTVPPSCSGEVFEDMVVGDAEALASRWSSVAVIDSDASRVARISQRLPEPAAALSPTATKGLEFDAVLVVEPAAMRSPDAGGWRPLFVALTRAVQHLELLGREGAPAVLGVVETTTAS